ncbi:MAG: hypothetical protein EXR98_06835 [Gemmataceae bacterium]|nr:hypothetical protein [Gemmataceae bacterium]
MARFVCQPNSENKPQIVDDPIPDQFASDRAGGRIKERKPMIALIGFGSAGIVWALLNFGFRAWEVPDVGEPLDREAFHAKLQTDNDNAGALAIHQAITRLDQRNAAWLESMAEAARLPAGVLELPRKDGLAASLNHLSGCRSLTAELLVAARAKPPGPAFEHLAQILALSRNLRNKASLESYLAGVKTEDEALDGLDQWLKNKPSADQLGRVLEELNRHARETPPSSSCLLNECYRSGGALDNPVIWIFAGPGVAGGMTERWLVGSIAVALESPWESKRKTRLWQLVWAGLFRGIETPHWELPAATQDPPTERKATSKILQGWLPAATGPGANLTRADVIRLVDASWLADDRLFCSTATLRNAATRARWRVDATRVAIALSLYRIDQGKPAPDLQTLVPRYLPAGLPADPYSGQPFRYQVGPLPWHPFIRLDTAIVWSTGPDRIDHGGRRQGGEFSDDDARWAGGDFDLIKLVPHWR